MSPRTKSGMTAFAQEIKDLKLVFSNDKPSENKKRSSIDEAMLTGEPIPVEKGPCDTVTGGTLNSTGSLIVRTERVGGDTTLSQIVTMVVEAQRNRAAFW